MAYMAQVNEKKPVLWIVTEGMAGTENPCLGVAESLGLTPQIFRIDLRQPWRLLSPWMGCEQADTFIPTFPDSWPDILITSGRKALAASRYIKKQSKGQCFTVHIQDPRVRAPYVDLIAVPHHDKRRGDRVLVTEGTPSRLTPDLLSTAKKTWTPVFEPVSTPRIAVLLGGHSKTHDMTPQDIAHITQVIGGLKAGVMITTSRRTHADHIAYLKSALPKDTYIWTGDGENPYAGMLAWADYIFVTEDSVSMICDAGTTGKPVYLLPLTGGSPKFSRFHTHMQQQGITRPWAGYLENWTYPPLNDTGRIAHEINRRLGLYVPSLAH